MKKILIISVSLLIIALLYACKKDKPEKKEAKTENSQSQPIQSVVKSDTIIILKHKIKYGEELIYFPVINKDTIHFEVSFTNVTDGSRIAKIRFQNNLTYREHYEFLKLIFRKASEQPSFYKLKYIDMNTLPATGDLAITVTKQLMQENENLETQVKDYKKVSELLMHTKITSDFNTLLKPYQIKITGYDLEKVFLMDKKYLSGETKLETRPEDMPDKILEAIVWMKVQRTGEKD